MGNFRDFLVNKEAVDLVRAEYGLDERRIKDAVEHLKDWLNLQPHLPHNCEDARLERWVVRCKNSLERTKSTIDMYYTLKTAVPELLMDRDPSAPWFKKVLTVGYAMPLPQLNDDLTRVCLVRLTDPDPDNTNMLHIFKAFLMCLDLGLCEDYYSGIVFVFNMDGITMGHIKKITFPLLKKVEACLKCFSAKIKGIHFINVPTFAEMLITFVKSVLKPKLASRVHAYSKDISTLTDKISPKILPVEYGGQYGTVDEIWTAWKEKVYSYRDWFLEQDKYKADEYKRPGKPFDSGELFGFEGSFRQLSVD